MRSFPHRIVRPGSRPSRIIGVNLLNDHSSSVLVFRQALAALQADGWEVHLFTPITRNGGLLSQLVLFVRLLFVLRGGADIAYVNSLLPFGAALAAKVRGCKVVYHLQEVRVRPELFNRFLHRVFRSTATHCIYGSRHQARKTSTDAPATIIYNSVPAEFTRQVRPGAEKKVFTVLMLCSLRRTADINRFVTCAAALPWLRFMLVLNAGQAEIDRYFFGRKRPGNLDIHPVQGTTHPFYQRASLVVNLASPDEFIESFGLTILEGMTYGLPVIAPPAGSIIELIDAGIDGFYVDSRIPGRLETAIDYLAGDPVLCAALGLAASKKAAGFSAVRFDRAITYTFRHLLLYPPDPAISPVSYR